MLAHEIDIAQLRALVAVADHGGVSAAADTLARTQSAVSQQMKRLESALGRPLFRRNGRGLVLTEDGAALVARARAVLAAHADALAPFERPCLEGEVRVGVPDDYAAFVLTRSLRAFAEAHPRTRLEVRCEPSYALSEALAASELDVAVVTRPDDCAQGVTLAREAIVWAASPAYGAWTRTPLPLALFKAPCTFRTHALQALEAAGRPYRIVFESASVAAIHAAIDSGLAVAALSAASRRDSDRLLDSADGLPPLPMSRIALLRAGRLSATAEAVAAHVEARFGAGAG